jgi:hypothetical protein
VAPTALNVQTITEAGMTPVAPAAGDNTNGNSFVNTGRQWIEASAGVGGGTFSVAFGYQVKGKTIPAQSYTVPSSGTFRAGPFDPAFYGTTLIVTPSATTVTLNVFQLG